MCIVCILYFVCVIVGYCQHICCTRHYYKVFSIVFIKTNCYHLFGHRKWHIFGVFHLNAKYIGVVDLFDCVCVCACAGDKRELQPMTGYKGYNATATTATIELKS